MKRGGGSTSAMKKHLQRFNHTLLVSQGVAAGGRQTTMDSKVIRAPNFQRDALFWMLMTCQVRDLEPRYSGDQFFFSKFEF